MANEFNLNVQYKDRLFKLIFRDKRDLLQLYNAVNRSSYDNPDDIEVNTMEDVIYMGMKNDISFIIHNVLNLYEHQSTFSPNFPLRGLFYFADIYRKIVGRKADLYSSRQVKLPIPQFIIFYNGMKEMPERREMYLHESFERPTAKGEGYVPEFSIDCKATILNVNMGHNKEIMMPNPEDAINKAVEDCIREGILADVLRDNREEVCAVLLREYDEQAHIDSEKQISLEEGREEVNRLVILLAEQGRTDDIVRAARDKEYQKKLFEEFGL